MTQQANFPSLIAKCQEKDSELSLTDILASFFSPLVRQAGEKAPEPPVEKSLENPLAARDFLSCKHLVLVLIDGLGWWNLNEYLGYAPNLRRLIRSGSGASSEVNLGARVKPEQGQRLTARSVFPSTTAAAITSLLTGLAPGAHNMLSYQVFDPQVGRRFNLINFEGYPGNVEDFQNQPTWFEYLNAVGVKSFALGPKKFVAGGLTRAALRGAQYVAVEKLDARARQAARISEDGALTYLYMAEVDHAGHGRGVGSEQWIRSLELADRAVGILLDALHPGVKVIVTADHGMLNSCEEAIYDLAQCTQAEFITQVSGEGRVVHLRVEASRISRVGGELSECLASYSPDTMVLSRSECCQLFTKYNRVAPRRPDLIGDLVIVSGGNAQVLDSRFFQSQTFRMKGVHGGLSEVEMRVPFLEYSV